METARTEVFAHKTKRLADNTRKSMNDLYHWIEPVYKCPISIAIILECLGLCLKEFEDSVGGVTGSERICEGILCQVYADLFGIVIESIDDELKTRRRHGHCRRYFVRDKSVITDRA
jgi:hypothetical protein